MFVLIVENQFGRVTQDVTIVLESIPTKPECTRVKDTSASSLIVFVIAVVGR